jgi:hypothetical protein
MEVFKMKKASLWAAVVALLSSTSIFASVPYPLPNLDNDPRGSFYVGITGIYAKPSESGIGLVTDSWQYLSGTTITSVNKPYSPHHELEGGFNIGYNFPFSPNSIEFSYFHLSNNNNADNTSNGAYSFGSIFFPDATLLIPPPLSSVSQLRYEVNQYDLFLGHQYCQVWGHFEFKPTFGLRYVNLKHNLPFAVPGYFMSKFHGIGPMFGLDGRFGLGYGFGIDGHLDGALLDGNQTSDTSVVFGGITYNYVSPAENRVVPMTNARIGGDYRFAFANKSLLTLEAGYQATVFVNAFDLIRGYLYSPALGGGVSPKIADIQSTDFTYQGPYLNLTYRFM